MVHEEVHVDAELADIPIENRRVGRCELAVSPMPSGWMHWIQKTALDTGP